MSLSVAWCRSIVVELGSRSSRPRWRSRCVTACTVASAAAGLGAASASAAVGQPGWKTYRSEQVDSHNVGVDVASGNLLLATDDLADGDATYHVRVTRFYNSQALAPADSDATLGAKWVFHVGTQVRVTYPTSTTATVTAPDGNVSTLTLAADGSYHGPAGYDGVLTRNADGSSALARAADTLSFDSSGTLSSVRDAAARVFNVALTSGGGRTLLSSFGTNDGRRANFSYTGVPRVREMDDPASGHHYYTYDSQNRLTGYSDNAGQTTYTYDGNGYLASISLPTGTSVAITSDSGGRTLSYTITRSGRSGMTTSFSYQSGYTIVTDPDGNQSRYTFDSDGRVTSVDGGTSGPGAFTCETASTDQPPPDLDPSAGTDPADAAAAVCPPNQQDDALGYDAPDETPDYDPSVSPATDDPTDPAASTKKYF